jgi:hypothetical protein
LILPCTLDVALLPSAAGTEENKDKKLEQGRI